MGFDFASAKLNLRRSVHDTLAVDATYVDDSMSAPEPIRARWHSKIDRFGDPESQGNAEMIQGIDRIGLVPSDYPSLTFRRGAVVAFEAYGKSFRLDTLEPSDGPLTRWWTAVVL